VSTQTDLLRKIDFFEPLEQKIINKIAEVCIEREYSKGEYIVKQGESGLGLFFITSGRVKVEIDRNGAKAVVAQLQSEDFLGELSIIDNKPRSANVICLEETSCLLLTRDSFSKILNKYPEIAIQMAKALAGRIRAANEKMGQPLPVSTEVPVASAGPGEQPAAAPAAAASTGTTAEAPAASASKNGSGSDSDAKAKDRVKDFLIDTFSFLYTVKALTRFSAAVVGCPVTVRLEEPGGEAMQAVIGDVKIALFPVGGDQVLTIDAYDDGDFSATILKPQSAANAAGVDVARFSGHLAANGQARLHVPRDGKAWLEKPA
jgi:CRP-like cAMP-binding protein